MLSRLKRLLYQSLTLITIALVFGFLLSPTYAFQVLDIPFPPPTPPDVPQKPEPPRLPPFPTLPPFPGEPTPTPTPTPPIGGPKPTVTPTPPPGQRPSGPAATPTPPPSQPESKPSEEGGGGGEGGAGEVLGLAETDSLTLEAMAADFSTWFNEMGFLAPPKVPESIVASESEQVAEPAEQSLPVRIQIPSLAINLTVTPSKIVNGFWETSDSTASFGLGSNLPGNVGNTVIFGHNRYGLFAPLSKVKENDEVVVETTDGVYTYIVVKKQIVVPNDVSVIKPTNDETLTLYTCTGLNDENRLVVVAKRTS